MLIKRAHDLCSTAELLQTELKHIKAVFLGVSYQGHQKIFTSNEGEATAITAAATKIATETSVDKYRRKKHYLLLLPYKSKKEDHIIKSMKIGIVIYFDQK